MKYNKNLEDIVIGDKIRELQELIQNKNIKSYITIKKSFREVREMKIPLIQYCVMKNAIECFKYLLVNGFDDPNKTMEDQTPNFFNVVVMEEEEDFYWQNEHRYNWNCMTTAIYFGNQNIAL